MDQKGTIRAVQSALESCPFERMANHRDRQNFDSGFPERFAQERFLKKFERPDKVRAKQRAEACWDAWILSDNELRLKGLYKPNWAIAKLIIARILSGFKLGPVSFTTGSEFTPTLGFNSIEAKLSHSEWTCTPDNLDQWFRLAYSHRAFKIAMRRRFAKLLASHGLSERQINRRLWQQFRNKPNPAFEIFCFKLCSVTKVVSGNRFKTVPKNNLVDRPICIEPLANILTQRRIGLGIRDCLKQYGIDLTIVADSHRSMIADNNLATIDLKNASDSIALPLVKYLLPKRLYDLIAQTRSEMTLGPDDNYYVINKVSSMGNGFTFELMSLILFALSRSYDHKSSVFGDDMIISNQYAHRMIEDLESVGFKVNMDKTHIYDNYRESCGAHYYDGYGYIESYDFRWPKNIGEVVTSLNKLSRLASIYPSFAPLFVKVYGASPAALYAENTQKSVGEWRRSKDPLGTPSLDQFTVKSHLQFRRDGLPMTRRAWRLLRRWCRLTYNDPRDASMHVGFEWVGTATSATVIDMSYMWAKYMMYLAAGRRVPNEQVGRGAFKSFKVVTLKNGTTIRWSEIVTT